jgi:hypothetical protein
MVQSLSILGKNIKAVMLSKVLTSNFLREKVNMKNTRRWCAFSTHTKGNSINSTMELNHVFANRSDIQGDLFPLTSKSRSSLHLIQGKRNLGETKINNKNS